jgi:ATP-binding cassette subfamily F protein 3
MLQSKLKQIEHMKIIDKPDRYDLKQFHAHFEPAVETVKGVLTVKDLVIGYNSPLATVNFELIKGQKLGVIGENGIGKSTLLKTLVKDILPISGEFTFGLRSEIGYFSQQMANVGSDKTVFDDFFDEFPRLTETEVRTALGSFLFTGDDVFKCVNDLSGGERVRLALCKIFKRRPNVLILDEPTNHMDIVGKETLENMLAEYSGTVIAVSHDRYFINKVADRLLVFENGEVNFYPIGYAEYEEREREKAILEESKPTEKATSSSGGKKTFSTPLKDKGKKERRVKKLEELIATTEKEIENLSAELENPKVYSDYVKVNELQDKIDKSQAVLEEYMTEWMTLTEELEQ